MREVLIGEVRGAADGGSRLCMRGRFAREVHFYTDGTAEADFDGTVGGDSLTDSVWERDMRRTEFRVTAGLRMRVSGGTGLHEVYAVAHEVKEV